MRTLAEVLAARSPGGQGLRDDAAVFVHVQYSASDEPLSKALAL
jgi:hypothetical protein